MSRKIGKPDPDRVIEVVPLGNPDQFPAPKPAKEVEPQAVPAEHPEGVPA